MKINLLNRAELEEIISNKDQFQLDNSTLFYAPQHIQNKHLLQTMHAEPGMTEEKLNKQLYKLEELTAIPASYLSVDLFGPSIYLQSTTHQPVTQESKQPIGRFVTRLQHKDLNTKIDLNLHEEVRKAIINTKAFTHNVQYNMEVGKHQAAQFKNGLLIADATKDNFNNLAAFLNDYFTEVSSRRFREQAKEAYKTIQATKDNLLSDFLEHNL